MKFRKNILVVGVDKHSSEKIKKVIKEGIGPLFLVQFYETDALSQEKISLIKNQYHIVLIHNPDKSKLMAQLTYIRMFDFRIQIIIYSKDDMSYFMVQRYSISFIIRASQLKQDLLDLSFALAQLYQNKQFYLPHHQRFLPVHSIYYMESSKNYIHIHSMEGVWKERFTIKELSQHQAFEYFLLISQSILLHPLHMQSIEHENITMEDGRRLFISRGKLQNVHQKLDEFQQFMMK